MIAFSVQSGVRRKGTRDQTKLLEVRSMNSMTGARTWQPHTLVCDALLDQEMFAGVGITIRNEVFFRSRVRPLSSIGALPAAKLRRLVEQPQRESFEFLTWKRRDTALRRAHGRSFFCNRCQIRYDLDSAARIEERVKSSSARTSLHRRSVTDRDTADKRLHSCG
jgi:hypothetical protein